MLERSPTSPDDSSDYASGGAPPSIGVGAIFVAEEPGTRGPGGLVLTRRLTQAIVIADEVEVQVVELKLNVVRLKITAPRSIAVHRREVFDAIRTAPHPAKSPASESPRRPSSRKGQGGLVLTRHVG